VADPAGTAFRLSTSDYLLRSLDALYIPARIAAAAPLAATGLHDLVERHPARAHRVLRAFRFAWLPRLALIPLHPFAPEAFDPRSSPPAPLMTGSRQSSSSARTTS
jgi:hypothetical protein